MAVIERRLEQAEGGIDRLDAIGEQVIPVRYDQHGQPHAHLITWLGVDIAATPGAGLGDNSSVRLDLETRGICCLTLRG